MEECIYSREDVCSLLGISVFTMRSWYNWQKKQIEEGIVQEEYLPHPQRIVNAKGQPLMWSLDMIDDLRMYQSSIVKGRNGKYGKYTNPRKH